MLCCKTVSKIFKKNFPGTNFHRKVSSSNSLHLKHQNLTVFRETVFIYEEVSQQKVVIWLSRKF